MPNIKNPPGKGPCARRQVGVDFRRILFTKIVDKVQSAYHATKGWRRGTAEPALAFGSPPVNRPRTSWPTRSIRYAQTIPQRDYLRGGNFPR